jgi:methionyl-tRNA synthetase
MNAIWNIVSWMDQTIQSTEPFKVIKIDKEEGEKLIRALLWDLNLVADLLLPFLPETAQKIKQLVMEDKMPETPLFLRKD